MKKLVSSGIAVMLLLAAAVGIVVADDSGQPKARAASSTGVITTEEAIKIAKDKVDGVVKEVEFKRDKRRSTYEIEMRTGQKEVELKMNATTGEIIKYEEEWDDDKSKYRKSKSAAVQKKGVEQAKTTPVQDKKANRTVISTEQAIQIAKTIMDGKVEDVELDKEDGRLIYEIEIEKGDLEVEVEIDAFTGEILDVEYDD